MAKKRRKEKSAAIITIRKPGKMSAQGRRDIAKWLRMHAAYLIKHGEKYTGGRFIGRYLYA